MNAAMYNLKEKQCEKKLEEADLALDRVIEYMQGLGNTSHSRITLLVKKTGHNGKDNTRGL